MTDLELKSRTEGDAVIITASGDLDIYTAPRLRELIRTLKDHKVMVIDLDRVEFLDSTGLAVLYGAAWRDRKAGRRFTIACTAEPILRVFRVTGLLPVLDVRESAEAALEGER